MPQQKTLQVLAGLARHAHRPSPRPDQIAHRLMRGIRNPDRSQFAGPVQPLPASQHHSIAAVGLHLSPVFTGISDGAATMQSCSISTSWR